MSTLKIIIPGECREATWSEIDATIRPIKAYSYEKGLGYDLADGTHIRPVGDGNYHDAQGNCYIELVVAECDDESEFVEFTRSLGFIRGRA